MLLSYYNAIEYYKLRYTYIIDYIFIMILILTHNYNWSKRLLRFMVFFWIIYILRTFTLFHEHTVYTTFLLSSLYMHTATRRVNLLINRTNNVPRDTWWWWWWWWLSLGLLIARKIQLSRFLFNFCTTTATASEQYNSCLLKTH